MKQNELLLSITKLIPKEKSLIEVISSVLDISYASAHRRTTNSAKLSIDEAVKLAKHFNLSLDMVFNVGDKNIIPVRKTQITSEIKDLELYFKTVADTFEGLSKSKSNSLIYCAKDLPVAHSCEENNLSRFKIFVWLKLLNPAFKNRTFDNFQLPNNIKKEYLKLGRLYKKLDVTEIWDVTTINSTLKQILYFSSINQLSSDEALQICKELKFTILTLKENATPESNYKLYYNELLLMGNKMLVKTPLSSSLYVQYTAFNYFNTTDKDTCDHTTEYLDRLLKDCKFINTSNEKERNQFFNKMLSKIESLQEHLMGQRVLDF